MLPPWAIPWAWAGWTAQTIAKAERQAIGARDLAKGAESELLVRPGPRRGWGEGKPAGVLTQELQRGVALHYSCGTAPDSEQAELAPHRTFLVAFWA